MKKQLLCYDMSCAEKLMNALQKDFLKRYE